MSNEEFVPTRADVHTPTLLAGLAALYIALSPTQSAQAATLTWSGGSASSAHWSDSANWGGAGTPANGDTLVFPAGQPRLINTNNISGLILNQIRFTGASGGYNIYGNAFTLTNSIMATNTIGINLVFNAITLANADVTVNVASNTTLTLRGNLGGSVGVTKTGLGTLNYYLAGGGNSYSGTTRVNAGTLLLTWAEYNGGFGGPLVIGDGSGTGSPTVRLGIDTMIPDTVPITINDTGLLDLNGWDEAIGSSLTLNGGAEIQTSAGMLTLGPNCVVTANPTNSSAAIQGKLNVGSGTCRVVVNGAYPLDLYATVSGSADIVKLGYSVLFLTASNSFTGNFHIGDGMVSVWHPWAFGTTNGITSLSNFAWLNICTNVGAEKLTVYSTNGSALRSFSPTSNSWAGDITLGVPTFIRVETNSLLNLLGTLSGPGGFTKVGPGKLRLSGNADNTYLGDTKIHEGVLELNKSVDVCAICSSRELVIGDHLGGENADVVRALAGSQINIAVPLTINSSGLLDLNGFGSYVGPLTFNGGDITTGAGTLYLGGNVTVNANTNSAATVAGRVSLPATRTIDVASHLWSPDITISAAISGVGGLIKNGPGELSLLASNSFSGAVTVNSGLLVVCDDWALGSTNAGTTVNSNGTLAVAYDTHVGREPLTLNSSGYLGLGSLVAIYGSNSWDGTITLNTNSTVWVDRTNDLLNLSGAVVGTGDLIKAGPGTLQLAGGSANTYSGATRVNEGTLRLAKTPWTNAVPGLLIVGDGAGGANADVVEWAASHQVADTADVIVAGSGALLMSTNLDAVGSLSGAGSVKMESAAILGFGINPTNATFSGTINGGSIWKLGLSTATLTGTNNTDTVVAVGTLLVNGYQPGRPAWVSSGATLGGTGTVGHLIVESGGRLLPGLSPGILTCSNLNFRSTAEYCVELNGTTPGAGYDQIKVRGGVTLSNATLRATLGFPSAISNSFTIIDNDDSDAVTNTFNGLPEGATVNVSGTPFRITYAGGSGNDVVLTQLTAQQRPWLSIAQANVTNVVLWWPTNFDGYTLTASTNLSTNVWSVVAADPVVIGANYHVTNPAGCPLQFYRLRSP